MRLERKTVAALAGLLLAAAAQAQLFGPTDSAWRDEVPPAPPALQTTDLIPVEVGGGTQLRFGIDPTSVSISPAGVVRYVVIARSAGGATNAMYEGLHCGGAMAKVYARHDAQRGWVPSTSDWRPLDYGVAAVRHSLAIAKQGACQGTTPNAPVDRMLRELARGEERR